MKPETNYEILPNLIKREFVQQTQNNPQLCNESSPNRSHMNSAQLSAFKKRKTHSPFTVKHVLIECSDITHFRNKFYVYNNWCSHTFPRGWFLKNHRIPKKKLGLYDKIWILDLLRFVHTYMIFSQIFFTIHSLLSLYKHVYAYLLSFFKIFTLSLTKKKNGLNEKPTILFRWVLQQLGDPSRDTGCCLLQLGWYRYQVTVLLAKVLIRFWLLIQGMKTKFKTKLKLWINDMTITNNVNNV